MYKINFNEYQKNIFSSVDFNGDKRNKLLSVFSYIIKYSQDGALTKSINKLYFMYVRYHYKISNKYFYKLIDTLIELNLLEKINNKIIVVQEKVQKKVQSFNSALSIENTSLEANFKKPKVKGLNNTKYSYNTTDVVAPVEIICKAEELLKELNIKSKTVKTMVIDKLKTCKNINRVGLVNYVLKVIAEKKSIMEQKRLNYKVNVSSTLKVAFNDYEQREYTNNDFENLEYRLLGWN